MGCGNSKTNKPSIATRPNTLASSNVPNRVSVSPNANAWDHPAPMKSPYPQGKPDEVLSHLRDPEWTHVDNVQIQNEVVPVQMEGKIVKESYAVQQGFAYSKVK